MATVTIDNKQYELYEGHNLLHAASSKGLDIPYFCWHPAMGSVGACRLCAVKQLKDENDSKGRLVMSCMTPVQDGTFFSIQDPEVVQFRKTVVEFLMVNHPHDCPICDEGGECHLQDMTVMTGHNYREYRFTKRTYRNQNLGPLITHEMNRCIQCYRCERFYADYAGGKDLQHFGSHDHVYFGRHEDGPFESEFSGNLVEICPTGVFTDKTLKQHYTRKWDMQTAPSVCAHCAVGCNTIPGERYGLLRRIRARYNGEVNKYFLCDRGRYGYEFVNHEKRLRLPLLQHNAEGQQPVNREWLNHNLQQLLKHSHGAIGIGSPRASLESNFALRQVVGEENFFAGMEAYELQAVRKIIDILQNGPARPPSLQEMHQADAVFILGEDITNTAPMMALAVRQALRQKGFDISRKVAIPDWHDAAVRQAVQDIKSPLYIASPAATKLDEAAKEIYRAAPGDIARLGYAVAHELDSNAPAVNALSETERALAQRIAHDLRQAQRPLIISGTSLNHETIHSAANAAWALKRCEIDAQLAYALPESNSMGLALMTDKALPQAHEHFDNSPADMVIVLENDLPRRGGEPQSAALLNKAKNVVVLDSLHTSTTKQAQVVLPAATFAEGDGTVVNNEGRAQRFYQVFVPEGEVIESWRWLQEMALAGDWFDDVRWQSLDELVQDLIVQMPPFASIEAIAPPAGFRIAGQKIPRQMHRYSGRTAMNAHKNVHEPKPPDDTDSPLSFSMEGYQGEPPAALIHEFWSPGWNSVQSVNKFQTEVGGPLHGGDPGRRLIEPGAGDAAYFDTVPEPFKASKEGFLFVPLYHIFGSEELSVLSEGIQKLAPQPYLALNPDDAANQQWQTGQSLQVSNNGQRIELPLRVLESLPRGVAGYSAGFPQLNGQTFPLFGKLESARREGKAAPAS